ncbi:hypothetical protein POSPLADRAFT_1142772, partial [Postia placenta MAD-698-R-SB12]
LSMEDSETSAAKEDQISQGRSLPVELWMHILGDVAEERNYDVIARCARVCQFFRNLCNKHLKDELTFGSEEDVARLKTDVEAKEIGGWRGPNHVTIWGEQDSKVIPHVATLASRFAGRWTRVEELTIEWASWPSSLRAANAAVFRDLSRFASITRLVLPKRKFTPTVWPFYMELLEFMSAVSNPCGKSPRAYSWGSVDRLHLHESVWWKFSSSSIARLLRALPSLMALVFENAGNLFEEMRITGISALHTLRPMHIRVGCWGARSRHGAHIVRSLIKMDYPLRITALYIPIYPLSRRTDMVATAINELIRHAGPSLEHLDLAMLVRGHARPGKIWEFKIAANQHRGSDLSENTNRDLESIRIKHLGALCLSACEILSHVTSTCISSVDIRFQSQWSDRGELSDVFTQLDVVLSLPVFDNLVRVLIHVEFGKHHRRLHEEEMQQWAYLMKPCLASLDKRGVLKIDTSGGISTPVDLAILWALKVLAWRIDVSKHDENVNVGIVEVSASEGSVPSGTIAAHTE